MFLQKIIEFTVLGVAVLVELLAGSIFFLYCPLAVLVVVYYSRADSFPAAMFDAVIAGTVIDLVTGRSELFSPFLLLIAIFAARIVLRREPDSLLECSLAGAAAAFGAVIAETVFAGTSGVLHFIAVAIFCCAAGALAMPVTVAALDGIGRLFGTELFMPERPASLDARRAARNRRVRLAADRRGRP
ncbi:MAG: hypothetical protein PHI35_01215 [Victivallaceae bacterium]|nr:hypothetical protein [Victivallaceae bacterium]